MQQQYFGWQGNNLPRNLVSFKTIWYVKREKQSLDMLIPNYKLERIKIHLWKLFCFEVIYVRLNTHHTLGISESHPQTLKGDHPVLWESHCLKVLAGVWELKRAIFHLVWHLWRLPDQRCWHRFRLSASWSSSLIQSVFPFVFLMCALLAVVTGAMERLLISLSLLMLTSCVIVSPFQPYIPRSPPSVSAHYGFSQERGLTLPYLLPN